MRGSSPRCAGRLGLIAGLALFSGAGAALAAGNEPLIYVGAWQSSGYKEIADSLREQLPKPYSYTLSQGESDLDVLRLVRADPRSFGFVQRDLFVETLQKNPAEFDRLEFYGSVDACLLAAVRKGSALRTYEDLVAGQSGQATSMDVGPIAGRVAESLERLRKLDPDLGNLSLEHRGGARALARVVSGDTDAALVIAHRPFRSAELDDLVDAGSIELVPLVSRRITDAASERHAGYSVREIELGRWLHGGRRYRTTCSTLGVVINERADLRLAESVAQAMLDVGLERGSDRSLGAWGEAVMTLVWDGVRLASNLGRMAVALVIGRQDWALPVGGEGQSSGPSPQDAAEKTTVRLRLNGNQTGLGTLQGAPGRTN